MFTVTQKEKNNMYITKIPLRVKDILPNYPLKDIMVRMYCCDKYGEEWDLLFGYCHWTGKELVSGDGDSYDLDDEVLKFEFDEKNKKLVYWIECELF